MDWTKPIAISLPQGATPFQRLVALVGHMDIRFYPTATAYVDIGAGSLPTVNNLQIIPGDVAGCLGVIGRFCEVHPSARIFVQGEHANRLPVNVTFTGFPIMRERFSSGLQSAKPFSIGSGVVISAGVEVLDGAQIGDGAVIGAGAVVTRPIEARAIAGGVPARKIGERPAFAPWWEFDLAYLLDLGDGVQEAAADAGRVHRLRAQRPPIEIHFDGANFNVKPPAGAPQAVIDYLTQAVTSPSPYWLADCWST